MARIPPVLVLQNESFETLGWIDPALRAADLAWKTVDLSVEPDVRVDLEAHSGLIVMGGPMSANDELEQVKTALGIVESALSRRLPVLGVCLGAQMIAKVMGGAVYRNPVKEIGWAPVFWTAAAHDDPLFAGLTSPETVFHWHGETFDLPHGAVWLAHSENCRHQAFRAGSNIYGLQFHLEVTPAMIEDWLSQEANAGDVRELAVAIDPHANAARLAELSSLVFGRWCELVQAAQE